MKDFIVWLLIMYIPIFAGLVVYKMGYMQATKDIKKASSVRTRHLIKEPNNS